MSAYQFIVKSATAPTTSTIVPARLANLHHQDNQRNQSRLTLLRLCLVLLALVFFLVGCGPEEGEADSDLEAETIRIAQEYQQSGDLGGARAQLEQLEVANPTQFLIFLAEERADSDAGSPETAALVHFALALGLQSGQLMDYALAHGLLANTAPPTPAVVTQPAAQSLAPVTSSDQTSATAPTAAPASDPGADAATNVPVAVIVDSTPGATNPGATNQESPAAEESAPNEA
jgi:hypothetical protein